MVRLLFGLLKGLVIGSIAGGAMVASGVATPGALVAYLAAIATAVAVSLVAGKKIWERDGRIQVLLKAFAALFLGPGLMWLVRSFATLPLPDIWSWPGVASLPGLAALQGQSLTLGSFAMTSLALVAAVLGGFYELDDTPRASDVSSAKSGKSGKGSATRIDPDLAAITGLDAAEIEAARGEGEKPKAKR
jgi:hypothetical protein